MLERMKGLIKHILILVMISSGGIGLLNCASSELSVSKESITSDIPTNNELQEKLKDGCEMIAQIKQVDGNCEMGIQIKKDFQDRVPEDVDEAINIRLLKGRLVRNCDMNWPLEDGDMLFYRKYKKNQRVSGVWIWYKTYRRLSRDDFNECSLNDEFTYAELFRAAEELVHQDKTKLGKKTIFIKKREFKEIPNRVFLWAPPRPAY